MSKLPERGTGLLLGVARKGLERGKGVPLGPEERRKRHEALFGQLGGGVLRDLLRDYIAWFRARPKLRERIPRSSSRPALF